MSATPNFLFETHLMEYLDIFIQSDPQTWIDWICKHCVVFVQQSWTQTWLCEGGWGRELGGQEQAALTQWSSEETSQEEREGKNGHWQVSSNWCAGWVKFTGTRWVSLAQDQLAAACASHRTTFKTQEHKWGVYVDIIQRCHTRQSTAGQACPSY